MTGERMPLRQLAVRNGGVLRYSEALAAGWSPVGLKRRLRDDGWERVRPGAWVEARHGGGFGLRLRAVQIGRPDLVVSHTAAAVVLGIEVLTARPEFTNLRSRRRPPEGGVLHRIPLDSAREVTAVAGLRVTTVGRTLADLLMTAPLEEALVAVESAITRRPVPGWEPDRPRERLIDLRGLAEVLDSYGYRRDVRVAQERLGLVNPLAGSPAETVARLRIYDGGLRPLSQMPLTAPDGRRKRADFFFPAAGLVVEIEGYAWHGSRVAHEEDVERFNALARCTEVRRVLRFTAREVFHRPQRMIDTIRASLLELTLGKAA